MKKIHILLVVAFSFLSIMAEPVKSMLGAYGNAIDFEEGIVPIEYRKTSHI